MNGIRNKTEKPLEFGHCNNSDFSNVPNKQRQKQNLIKNKSCLKNKTDIGLIGNPSTERFEYLKIKFKPCQSLVCANESASVSLDKFTSTPVHYYVNVDFFIPLDARV